MTVSTIVLAPETLEELDRLERDLVVAAFFSDERPLMGLNGLVDWRLNGRLSRLLMSGRTNGQSGERTLTNASGRLPAPRLLLYGLGPSASFDNMVFVRAVERILDVATNMRSESCALAIPGSHLSEDFALERLAILCKEIRQRFRGAVTLFIDRRHNFREMQAKFELIRREFEKMAPQPAARGRS